ncbi:MAG TPA: hypothetical protein VFN18_10900 [Solirubrobacterales bacterium]|nr:hypothetical protein [Solirubrobacterales bacterium]
MTERFGLIRSASLLLATVALVLALGPLASRAGATFSPALARSAGTDRLLVPPSFRLSGSNGYTLDVIGEQARSGRPASVTIYTSAKGRGARYSAPAKVTETSMSADLGDLGEIDLNFARSGRATEIPCGKKTIRFDSGKFEGRFAFHGEEGFTSAETTSVPGNIDFLLAGFCTEEVSEGPFKVFPGGATLAVRGPGLGPELLVNKPRPGAAATISAWYSENVDGISISRYAYRSMSAGRFRYDARLLSASLRPPPPFSGRARFALRKKAGKRWSGDLAVDLPGRAGVPLTGPSLRATLSTGG